MKLGHQILCSLLLVPCCAVQAQEENPAYWLLMPLVGQIAACAKQSPEMRKQLDEGLQTAQATSPKLLPPSAWEILRIGLDIPGSKSGAAGQPANCEETAAFYRRSTFSLQLRQLFAAQFTTSLALQCMVQRPESAVPTRRAWLAAFNRNGFEISDQAIDQSAENTKQYLAKKKIEAPTAKECEQLPELMFGSQFDARFSEAGIYELFDARR